MMCQTRVGFFILLQLLVALQFELCGGVEKGISYISLFFSPQPSAEHWINSGGKDPEKTGGVVGEKGCSCWSLLCHFFIIGKSPPTNHLLPPTKPLFLLFKRGKKQPRRG